MSLGKELKRLTGPTALRIINQALGLALTILLARWLAPDAFGQYALFISIAALAILPFQAGIAELLFREGVNARAAGTGIGAPLRHAITSVLLLTALLSLTVLITLPFLRADWQPLAWFLPLVCITASATTITAALQRAQGGVALSLLIDPGVRLLVMVVLVGFAWWLDETAIAAQAIRILCLGYAAALGLGLLLAFARIPGASLAATDPVLPLTRFWIAAGSILLISVGVQLNANIDIIALGLLASDEAVAGYKVAALIALQVAFPVWLINSVYAADLGKAIRERDTTKLRQVFNRARGVGLAAGIGIFIIVIVAYRWLINLVFGEAYLLDPVVVGLLGLAHLANLMLGPVGMVLLLMNRELQAARVALATAGLNLVLNPILILTLGVPGAALATLLAAVIYRVLLTVEFNRQLTRLDATAAAS